MQNTILLNIHRDLKPDANRHHSPPPPPQFRNPQNEQNRNNANLNQTLRSRSPGRITLRSRSPGRALDSRTLPNPFVTDTPQNKPRNRITRL